MFRHFFAGGFAAQRQRQKPFGEKVGLGHQCGLVIIEQRLVGR